MDVGRLYTSADGRKRDGSGVQDAVRVIKYVLESSLKQQSAARLVRRRIPDGTDSMYDRLTAELTSTWSVHHFSNLNHTTIRAWRQ